MLSYERAAHNFTIKLEAHMTTNEIISEIAKLDGWNPKPEAKAEFNDVAWGFPAEKPKWWYPHQLPPYLTSYDAILLVIQKQPMDTIAKIIPMTFRTTPAQIAEALLRASDKWKE